ncbi:hypothetical protein LXL04_038516 [Taraxacum kok-saghyz]
MGRLKLNLLMLKSCYKMKYGYERLQKKKSVASEVIPQWKRSEVSGDPNVEVASDWEPSEGTCLEEVVVADSQPSLGMTLGKQNSFGMMMGFGRRRIFGKGDSFGTGGTAEAFWMLSEAIVPRLETDRSECSSLRSKLIANQRVETNHVCFCLPLLWHIVCLFFVDSDLHYRNYLVILYLMQSYKKLSILPKIYPNCSQTTTTTF